MRRAPKWKLRRTPAARATPPRIEALVGGCNGSLPAPPDFQVEELLGNVGLGVAKCLWERREWAQETVLCARYCTPQPPRRLQRLHTIVEVATDQTRISEMENTGSA